VEGRILKVRASRIEELIPDNEPDDFRYGEEPRLEVCQEPLLHHFFSSLFCLEPEQIGGRLRGSLRCPGRKRFRFPARFAREPDQHSSTISLWIAHYRPTSVMKPRAMNAKNYSRSSPGSFPRDRFPLQFRILAGKICHRAPLLQAVIGHAQLKGLNPSFTFVRKLPAQFGGVAVSAWLRQEEARPRHGFLFSRGACAPIPLAGQTAASLACFFIRRRCNHGRHLWSSSDIRDFTCPVHCAVEDCCPGPPPSVVRNSRLPTGRSGSAPYGVLPSGAGCTGRRSGLSLRSRS